MPAKTYLNYHELNNVGSNDVYLIRKRIKKIKEKIIFQNHS